MKRILLAAAIVGALASPAHAPIVGRGGASPAGCSVGSYVGPGDVLGSASFWWGLRAYSAAFAGSCSSALQIRRASDNVTTNVNVLASGDLDVASASTFCTATTCFVTKLYDQSGNGINAVQATQASQPQLIFNCIGSLPCLSPAGSQYLLATLGGSIAQPYSLSEVVERTGTFTSVNLTVEFSNNPTNTQETDTGFYNVANKAFVYDSGSGNTVGQLTCSDSAWHAIQYEFNGSSTSLIRCDATDSSVFNFFAPTPTNTKVGVFGSSLTAGTQTLTGSWTESGLWPVAFSPTNRTNLCSNEHAYWSTPTSC